MFVLGAGSGIGQSICQILAKDGVKIAAFDSNISAAQKTIETLSSKSI